MIACVMNIIKFLANLTVQKEVRKRKERVKKEVTRRRRVRRKRRKRRRRSLLTMLKTF